MKARLCTFDVFGTLVDWRRGLAEDLAGQGIALTENRFDRLLEEQEGAERSGHFRCYGEILAWSLVRRLGLAPLQAQALAEGIGGWPLFAEVPAALGRMPGGIRLAAMTNSDRAHGGPIRERLGVELAAWVCAEDVQVYKPAPGFWEEVGMRLGIAPGPEWWHVSAYADYDLATAKSLGLTTVLVRRPHHRAGPADHVLDDLSGLPALLQ